MGESFKIAHLETQKIIILQKLHFRIEKVLKQLKNANLAKSHFCNFLAILGHQKQQN